MAGVNYILILPIGMIWYPKIKKNLKTKLYDLTFQLANPHISLMAFDGSRFAETDLTQKPIATAKTWNFSTILWK